MKHGFWRKKWALCLCCALLCALGGAALAAEAEAPEQVLIYGVVAVDPEAESLDLSKRRNADAAELADKLALLPNLREVHLGAPGMGAAELRGLVQRFPQIAFTYTLDQYGLWTAQDATRIDLGDRQIFAEDYEDFVAFLDCLPQLTQVDMFQTSLKKKSTAIDIDALAERYPDIRFGWTLRIGDHDVRTDLTAWSTLHNRNSPTHRSEDFTQLKYCKDMLALDIGHNRVVDISFLEDMPQLRYLIIAINEVEDITPLAKLDKLEYLEIFKNYITDISPLANLTNLKDLNICFNRIKDYSPLYELTQLERLWLYNSNSYSANRPIPEEDLEAIHAALPDCYIDYVSYSTLGGWREHPRYFVIFETFNEGGFVPFAESYEWDGSEK